MLITILGIYLAVYACALFAARRGRGTVWALYAVAVLVVPPVFGGLFYLVYMRVDPVNAPGITQALVGIGVALAVVGYPLGLWRARRGR
jgi:hypothetical protein